MDDGDPGAAAGERAAEAGGLEGGASGRAGVLEGEGGQTEPPGGAGQLRPLQDHSQHSQSRPVETPQGQHH